MSRTAMLRPLIFALVIATQAGASRCAAEAFRFDAAPLLEATHGPPSTSGTAALRAARYTLDPATIAAALSGARGEVSARFRFTDDQDWDMELEPVDLLADDFVLRVSTADGIESRPKSTIRQHTYRGRLRGRPGSEVRLIATAAFISAQIIDEDGEAYMFATAEPLAADAATRNIVYAARIADDEPRMRWAEPPDWDGRPPGVMRDTAQVELSMPDANPLPAATLHQAELAFFVDYRAYADFGNSMDALVTHLMTVLNFCNGYYDDLNIEYVLVELFVSTDLETEPWSGVRDAGELLKEVDAWVAAGGAARWHDLGCLWTGVNVGWSYAWVDEIGTYFRHFVCDSWNAGEERWAANFLAHESGHVWGAGHVATSSQWIMSPAIYDGVLNWHSTTRAAFPGFIAKALPYLTTTGLPPVSVPFLWYRGVSAARTLDANDATEVGVAVINIGGAASPGRVTAAVTTAPADAGLVSLSNTEIDVTVATGQTVSVSFPLSVDPAFPPSGTVGFTFTYEDPTYTQELSIANVRLMPRVVYVSQSGTHLAPYADWVNGANDLQSAVSAAVGGTLILVSNGIYSTEAEILLAEGIAIRGVGGPQGTTVDAQGTHRVFQLAHAGAHLRGLTITGGRADSGGGVRLTGGGTVEDCIVTGNTAVARGGGVYCHFGGTLRNSVVTGNTAEGNDGGGVYSVGPSLVTDCTIANNHAGDDGGGIQCGDAGIAGGIVRNSLVRGNTAADKGGGVFLWNGGRLDNSLVVGNTAAEGGGVSGRDGGLVRNSTVCRNTATAFGGGGRFRDNCGVVNTILYDNTAPQQPNWHDEGTGNTFDRCCTTPAVSGSGNIAQPPRFVDAGGDFHLTADSPCIDAAGALSDVAADLDGIPRPLDGDGDADARWDIGAYEYVRPGGDTDGDGMTDHWELTMGLDPTDATGDHGAFADADRDTMNTLAEFTAGTDPTNAASLFKLALVPADGAVVVGFETLEATGPGYAGLSRRYALERATSLLDAVWHPVPGYTNIPASGASFQYTNPPLPGAALFIRATTRLE